MASRKDAQKARMRRLSLNEKDDDTLSLNRPKSPIARAAARTQAAKRPDTSSTLTDKEMRQIDKDIEARAKAKAKDKAKSGGGGSSGKGRKSSDDDYILTDKEVRDIIKEGNYKVKPKLKTEKGKRGLIFGKDAKFRPFGGILARALLGEDEKFGGDRGAIDFIRSKKKPQKKSNGGEMKKKGYSMGGRVRPTTGPNRRGGVQAGPSKERSPTRTVGRKDTPASTLSPAQQRMLRSAQGYAQDTGQNPAELQRLTAQYGDLNAAQRREMAAAKRKRRQQGAARRGGAPGMMGGGMMKSKMASKGGKMGGKIPPGMKKGGAVRKKARGVGAAKRGFGKAMR